VGLGRNNCGVYSVGKARNREEFKQKSLNQKRHAQINKFRRKKKKKPAVTPLDHLGVGIL